jgi:Tol biopolymer transport system component
MKRLRMVLLLLFLLSSWAACSSGHLGSNIIAFIRDGHLWTIDPDGANSFDIVAIDVPVVSYAWSPDHQLLTFRVLDVDFAKTNAAQHLTSNSITGQIGDIPSTTNTIGVDGGTPITTAFSSPDVRYSSATWNPTGTRLLYRQTATNSSSNPATAHWWVSQNDQPGGIAIKSLPNSYSIPSLSYDTATQAQLAIGNSNAGVFTTTLAGTNLTYLQHEPLIGHPLPASLERILWQPAHQHARFLYALPDHNSDDTHRMQLVQRTLAGQTTTLATCDCIQFAWSPDGNQVLYSTSSTYTIMNISDLSSFTITGVANSIPYWSPDSRFLVLDGPHTLMLVQITNARKSILLSDTSNASGNVPTGSLPATNALLQPVANSIWAADSRHFLFLTRQRLLWQGHQLNKGKGLYTVTIDNSGHPIGTPVVVDTGKDSQAGWTYQDPDTSFLY